MCLIKLICSKSWSASKIVTGPNKSMCKSNSTSQRHADRSTSSSHNHTNLTIVSPSINNNQTQDNTNNSTTKKKPTILSQAQPAKITSIQTTETRSNNMKIGRAMIIRIRWASNSLFQIRKVILSRSHISNQTRWTCICKIWAMKPSSISL